MVKVFLVVRHDNRHLEDLEDMELHFLPRYKDEIVLPNAPGVRPRILEVLSVRQIVGPFETPTVFCRDIPN
jgi:hypothetical protein